ncbi:hypothetical protein RP20_CCG014823 [Aedes albopictus]|uniref:Putative ribonuclease h2 non-catalytic subunit n=1 Tax=Aedes albopictus TaxID=7160 RepID=A0A023EE88_AEDAL|nr:hypothetical protein RP20_CCG014823 [Aedes albopictus]
MAINLNFKSADVKASLQDPAKLHYIPATIRGDGPAKVEQYFESYTEELEDKTLVNALRGFPLRGKRFTLPPAYSGVMFQETKKPLSADEERTMTFAGAFKEFTYWNYDKIPSKNDAFEKALDWMELSDVLHEPLEERDEAKSDGK